MAAREVHVRTTHDPNNDEGYVQASFEISLGLLGGSAVFNLIVCTRCGALVFDKRYHDRFHDDLRGHTHMTVGRIG